MIPRFLWLKYQVLICFEDLLKTTEVRPGVYEKLKEQKMFIYHKSAKGIKINVRTVIEQAF